jgi:hypothetical protein
MAGPDAEWHSVGGGVFADNPGFFTKKWAVLLLLLNGIRVSA